VYRRAKLQQANFIDQETLPVSPHKQAGRKVLLLDVCHTLYQSNTTFDFLAWYFPQNPDYQSLQRKRKNILNRISARLGINDGVRERSIALLNGIPESRLEAAATEFVNTLKPIEQVHCVVDNYQQQGYELVLLSSSLDFIVRCVGKLLDSSAIHATELNYDNLVCNGTIKHDLLHTKATVIKNYYAGLETVFITDNRTDLACANLVSKFVAVHRLSDSSSANYWRRKEIKEILTYA